MPTVIVASDFRRRRLAFVIASSSWDTSVILHAANSRSPSSSHYTPRDATFVRPPGRPMALNATTCYNKAVAAGYGSYPSPLTAVTGVPSAAMCAGTGSASASAVAGGGSSLSSSSSAVASSSCRSAGSGSQPGYRVKDFNVPLHVDCSVEYEMPSSAKPPVGGKVEPLLMIHPSYYRKAESRTRSLFVNNMPAASASLSGRSRPSAVCNGNNNSNSRSDVVPLTVSADGPTPAKRPYAGPAPGVTASTNVYGVTVTGAAAAAAGASQWPPLGSSAEHVQHHDGKRTMDIVQRQYQQHLQASLPPVMMTAALPTDKTHMTG